MSEMPFVSIIIPVKNAEKFIFSCLNSLNNLNYPKDKYEVIISDSNSSDRTREMANSMGAKVIMAQGESVCAGRNSGFSSARGEIIAFSDADCVMDRDWISNAIKYFKDEGIAGVGGVSLIPDDETPFGKACGFLFSIGIFTGGSTYGMNFNHVREVRHLPGCNCIYRRSALERVMPIDEKFIEGEDVIMTSRLKALGYRFLYTPDTKVWHYRSSTPKRFWRQNFRYAIGRVLMGRESNRLINPLHIIAGFSIPISIAAILLLWFISMKAMMAVIFLGLGFLAMFSILGWFATKSAKAALNIPLAIIFLIIPWSLGFMREFFLKEHKA